MTTSEQHPENHAHDDEQPEDPTRFWQEHYGQKDQIWSGKVNATTAELVQEIARNTEPGTALELGCGEGGDAIWLAEQGWEVTALDISETAVDRARAATAAHGVKERIHFAAQDLTAWRPEGTYDLVTASFFQSPVALDRISILQRAARALNPGGHLVVVAHAAAPSWAPPENHEFYFPTPQEDLESLSLGEEFNAVYCEVRRRDAVGPEGQQGVLDDSVIVVRRQA